MFPHKPSAMPPDQWKRICAHRAKTLIKGALFELRYLKRAVCTVDICRMDPQIIDLMIDEMKLVHQLHVERDPDVMRLTVRRLSDVKDFAAS